MKKLLFVLLLFTCMTGYSQEISKHTDFRMDDVVIKDYGDYKGIYLPDRNLMTGLGNPGLPMQVYTFVVPHDAYVKGINAHAISRERIPGDYMVYPIQQDVKDGLEDDEFQFTINEEVYNSQIEYPQKKAEIIRTEIQMGYQVVIVGVYPISYIPAKKELYLSNISFSIEYTENITPLSFSDALPRQSDLRAEKAMKLIKTNVENPQDVDLYAPPVTIVKNIRNILEVDTTSLISPMSALVRDELVPEYIIISNKELKESFQQLADWKTQKGIPAIIKTVEDIYKAYPGVDKPEQIRNYLIECYRRWGAGLYILIGGNIDIVPARFYSGYPSDLYYQTTSGTWYDRSDGSFSPSINGRNYYVGRAPVRNKADAENFIGKVIFYEKAGISDKTYFNNYLSALAFMERADCDNVIQKDQIRYSSPSASQSELLLDVSKWNQTLLPSHIRHKSMIDNHSGSGNIYTYHNRNGVECYDTKAKRNIHKATPGDYVAGDLEKNNLNFSNELNDGNHHIIFQYDHSSVKSIGTSSKDKGESFSSDEAASLRNGDKLQIMYSRGCKSSTFSVPDNFGAEYINARKGGGVAYLGYSDDSYRNEYPEYKRFLNYLYHDNSNYDIGHLFYNIPETTNARGIRHFQLFGDPAMQVFTSTPQQIDARVEEGYTDSGIAYVPLYIQINTPSPEEGFDVCISKGTEYYMRTKLKSGVEKSYNIDNCSTGKISVIITGHNFVPYIKEIFVESSSIPTLVSIEIDDTGYNGNGDGRIDAGETVTIRPKFRPNGVGLNKLKTASITNRRYPYTILKDVIDYENEPEESQHFVVTFDKDMEFPDGITQRLKNDLNPVFFLMNIAATLPPQMGFPAVNFKVDVYTSNLEPGRKTMSFSSGKIMLDVELQNTGMGAAPSVQARLTALNNTHVLLSPTAEINYGSLEPGESLHRARFVFETNGKAFIDGPTSFLLELEDGFGRSREFTFNIEDAPTQVVSGIKSEPRQHEITLKWTAASGSNIQGYNIYRSSDPNLLNSFVKVNRFVNPFNYFVDYDLSSTTRYYYQIAVVGKDGTEGPLSEIYEVNTSFGNKGLFPVKMDIPINYAYNSEITFYDFNDDRKMEFFSSMYLNGEGYLLGFKPDGTELFNLDYNTTTYSGFANVGANISGAVSLGNIEGYTSKPQAIIAKGSSPQIIGYVNEDTDNDNHPDIRFTNKTPTSSGNIQSAPVLAALTPSPLNSMDVIIAGTDGKIDVYNPDGTLRWSRAVPPLNTNPQSNIAVGYLGDPSVKLYKDIVIGTKNGVYAIDKDGEFVKPFSLYYPIPDELFKKDDYIFSMSNPVIADIDGDGIPEIIIRGSSPGPTGTINGVSVRKTTIFVVDRNGKLKQGWGKNITNSYNLDARGLAVADIYGDGNLYVVESGLNVINIYNKNGVCVRSHEIPDLTFRKVPLIADMDGDGEAEVIVVAGNKIVSYKMDGSITPGFPIELNTGDSREVQIGVCDLDRTGYSDLVAIAGSYVYVWETPGRADRIEWGMARKNAQHTGEYKPYTIPINVPVKAEFDGENDSSYNKEHCTLYQNTPNPVTNTTGIRYFVPCKDCKIDINIYNLQAGLVKSFTNLSQGEGSVSIDTGELPGGIYIYTLMVNGELIDSKRMMVE